MASDRPPLRPAVLLGGIALLCLIWGSTWLVIREGLHDLPPLTSLVARGFLAGATFVLVAPRVARMEGGRSPGVGLSLVYAIGIFALPYAVIYEVETVLPSGLVSVLWSIYPILLAVFAHVLLPSERMRPRQWLGLVVGFAGVTAMLWTDVRDLGPEAVPAGLFLLLSPFSSALATPFIKRAGGTSSALLNRNGLLLGSVLLLPIAWTLERDAPARWTPGALGSIAYLALVGTVLAFGLYFWLLRHASATAMSLIAFAVPMIALALGAVLGAEPVGPRTVAGMLAILSGVALVVLGKGGRGARLRSPARSAAEPVDAGGSEDAATEP